MNHILRLVGLLVAVCSTAACAGARGSVSFDNLVYPVSSSGALYTADERQVSGAQLEQLGQIELSERLWSTFWSAIPLHGPRDLSASINEQIAQAGGEGAVGLSVDAANCGTNYIALLNWLPIYPGCVLVTVRGQIVKRPPARLVAAPSPPAAAPKSATKVRRPRR